MKKILTIIAIAITTNAMAQVTDIDGNVYQTVQIGTQLWMSENLKVTRFSNGDSIPQETQTAYDPAWLYYSNNAANDSIYGKLYTGSTPGDNRNVCPIGWHVPSNADWTTLINFLGGDSIAGKKIKSNNGWDGMNESGFNGLPAGFIYGNNAFMLMGTHGYWWSSTPLDQFHQYFTHAESWSDEFNINAEVNNIGMSIRCINDSSYTVGLINQNNSENNLAIYPNPANNTVNITNLSNGATIRIMDINEKVVHSSFNTTKYQATINTAELNNGIYLIVIEQNGTIINKKLIVNR